MSVRFCNTLLASGCQGDNSPRSWWQGGEVAGRTDLTESGWAWADYVGPRPGEGCRADRIPDGYFRAAHEAIAQRVDLRGLIVWCFRDNFASSMGDAKRFGLVWTDFATQQRIPKQSSLWYRDVILSIR
jgi:beta-glucosidase